MSSLKCSLSFCANLDRNSDLIVCQGLCQRTFHGLCLGLERKWQSSKLKDNYFCDKCLLFQDVLKKVNADNLSNLQKLSKSSNMLINKATRSMEFNTEMLENFCQRLDDCTLKPKITSEQSIDKLKTSLELWLKEVGNSINLSVREQICILLSPLTSVIQELNKVVNEKLDKVELMSTSLESLKASVNRLNLLSLDSISSLSASHADLMKSKVNNPDILREMKNLSEHLDFIDSRLVQSQCSKKGNTSMDGQINRISTAQVTSGPPSSSLLSELRPIFFSELTTSYHPITEVSSPRPDTVTIIESSDLVPSVFQFGTTWSIDDWNSRIDRIKNSNINSQPETCRVQTVEDDVRTFSLFLKGAPSDATSDWLYMYAVLLKVCNSDCRL